jgi:hypothetical protein
VPDCFLDKNNKSARPSQGRRVTAAARPSGQWRRKSHQPQADDGAGGNTSSYFSGGGAARMRSSASAHSIAISSARRMCRDSDSSVCSQASTCPDGRWCSSTRRQSRRKDRAAATAYNASASELRASSTVSTCRPVL